MTELDKITIEFSWLGFCAGILTRELTGTLWEAWTHRVRKAK